MKPRKSTQISRGMLISMIGHLRGAVSGLLTDVDPTSLAETDEVRSANRVLEATRFDVDEPHDDCLHPGSDDADLYYVQNTRTFCGNAVVWWRPDGKGYTTHIDEAGKYKLSGGWSRETDILWPVGVIDKLWRHHVDMQDLRQISDKRLTKRKRDNRLRKAQSKGTGV